MKQQTDYFPILNIGEFNEGESQNAEVLYHDIVGKHAIDEPHKHDFFIIMLFSEGSGTHIIDFTEYRIGKHQVHLMFPGQVHQWWFEENTVGCQLMISRHWLESYLASLRFFVSYYQTQPVFTVSTNQFARLLYEFQSIQKELSREKVFLELVQARSQIIGLLIRNIAEALFADFELYKVNPVLSHFLNLIDRYFRKERSVAFYANELHISPNYLNILCKRTMKTNASTLIQDRVLLEAKRLLKISAMSMKDIIFELGFMIMPISQSSLNGKPV